MFVSDQIKAIIAKHRVSDYGETLSGELTTLFTQMLVQAVNTGIQFYITQGIQARQQKSPELAIPE